MIEFSGYHTIGVMLVAIGFAFLFYTWLGYPVVVFLLKTFASRPLKPSASPQRDSPKVTILLTVRNEADMIRERIRNYLALRYPKDRLQIIVASDASTDGTDEIVSEYAFDGVILFRPSVRQPGKTPVQNEAIKLADGDIIVFCDADAELEPDFVERIVEPFLDPEIGCVTSRLEFVSANREAPASSVNLFWRWESWIRSWESEAGILFTASGAAMAFRRTLFQPMDIRYGDDCILPYDILLQGARIVYQPEAKARIQHQTSSPREFRARIRMVRRNLGGTLSRISLLKPIRHFKISFSIISHKLLRWCTPIFFLFILAGSVLLHQTVFGKGMLGLAAVFGVLVISGCPLSPFHKTFKLGRHAYYFFLANLAFLIGLIQTIGSKNIVQYK